MITPPYLTKGDKIAIVSTARKVTPAEMDEAFRVFGSWGLQVVTGTHLFGQSNQFSGTDEERTADMQMMLNDTSIKAIVCARGGYGTIRIIDKLDFTVFKQHPKWIVGYSDITVLHSHVQTQLGIETVHATMPINFCDSGSETSIETLQKALFGEPLSYTIEPHELNIAGNVSGQLTGGNLSILYSLLGSASDIETRDKVLFIEDLDEYLYHIDRMMVNMKRNGKFDGLKGIIVGGLTKMNDNTVPFGLTAEQIISEYAQQYTIPVCFNFPAGHMADNRALVMGREIQLNVEPNAVSVQFLPAVDVTESGSTLRKILKPALFFLGFMGFIYLIISLLSKLAK